MGMLPFPKFFCIGVKLRVKCLVGAEAAQPTGVQPGVRKVVPGPGSLPGMSKSSEYLWHKVLQWARARKCAACITNPFKFTKELLGQRHSGKLACSQDNID